MANFWENSGRRGRGRGDADALALLTHGHTFTPRSLGLEEPGLPASPKKVGASPSLRRQGSCLSRHGSLPVRREKEMGGQNTVTKQHICLQLLKSSGVGCMNNLLQLTSLSLSYMICVWCGDVNEAFVDSSFFKAIGLLLAVMLSLRAKNAISRRQLLIGGLMRIMNAAWTLVTIVDPKDHNPQRLVSYLAFCFQEIAFYIDDLGEEKESPHAIDVEELDEKDREAAFVMRPKGYYHESPRPLLMRLRQVCDDLFDPVLHVGLANEENPEEELKVDKWRIVRRYHVNVEKELGVILDQFDSLRMFKEPLLTPHFTWMIQMVIFVYVALYPWCVADESALVLGLTTIGMGAVFYGLNHVTSGLENSITEKGQGFQLSMTFHQMFDQWEHQREGREACKEMLELKKKDGMEVKDMDFKEMHGEIRRQMDQEDPADSMWQGCHAV